MNEIREILDESRAISLDIARMLKRRFGMSAESWLTLQQEYERVLRVQVGEI